MYLPSVCMDNLDVIRQFVPEIENQSNKSSIESVLEL